MSKGIYINDSIHGLIRLSEYEKQVISSVGFNRLHDVYQNSTVYLTFPSNRTKRFEHSIGTMKLCSDIFYHSIENATSENISKFYDYYENELKTIISDIGRKINEYDFLRKVPKELPEVDMDSFRMSLTPRNVPGNKASIHVILIESVRIAALLHDIGHPPFSHVVERAMKAVFDQTLNKEGSGWEYYRDKMSAYFGRSDRALHEVMGDEISASILKEIAQSGSRDGNSEEENLFRVIVLECVLHIFDEKSANGFTALHRIIDGSVDGDRLDYVTRDPVNSGLNNGVIDYNRIILDMQMVMRTDENPMFCIPVKAVNAVEDYLKRRYDLYKKIIFHHRVIKTDFLLESSVKSLIELYLEKMIDENDSHEFIPFDISGLWYPLGTATLRERGNALSQWNDSWLMTILKKEFFTEFYGKNKGEGTREDIIEHQLAELLRHDKSYYSLIKRNEDFKVIDQAVKKTIDEGKDKLMIQIDSLNKSSKAAEDALLAAANNPDSAVIDIQGTLNVVKELLGEVERDKVSYIIPFIIGKTKSIGISDFEDSVQKISDCQCKKTFAKVYDTRIVFKSISIGTDKYPVFFIGSDGKTYTLDEISGVSASLRQENALRPAFYLYSYIDDEPELVNQKKEDLQIRIGQEIGKFVIERLNELLSNLENRMK